MLSVNNGEKKAEMQDAEGRRERLGRNIKARREAMGLTSAELSKRAGLDRSYVSTVETATRGSYPKRETLERLARALGADVETLEGSPRHVARDLTPYDRDPAIRAFVDALVALQPKERRRFEDLLTLLMGALAASDGLPRITETVRTLETADDELRDPRHGRLRR